MLKGKPSLKIIWDLSPIFKSDNDPNIEKSRREAEKNVTQFVKKWKNRKDYLIDPKILKIALDEYDYWLKHYATNAKEQYYFNLKLSLDQNDPDLKARDTKANELGNKLQNEMLFFELSIGKIEKKIRNKFINSEILLPYKHFLETLFTRSDHWLSEAEEKIMNLKSEVSHEKWTLMTAGLISKEERKVLDENGKSKMKNFSEILALVNSQNKKIRDSSAQALNEIFLNNLDVAENEINAVLLNKKINDEIRKYLRPDSARHLGDDIETEVVDTLVNTVTNHFEIAQRFYKLKTKLLGLPKLQFHERNVSVGNIDKLYTFDKSLDIIGRVFKDLDEEFYNIFDKFVYESRVDVFPNKGKRGGAFATYRLPTLPTYILLNYNERLDDILTFAHELGHGINFELVKKSENGINFGTPTSTAEVASTFMEDFVLEEVRKDADDELKLSINVMKLGNDISTIFRQVAFYNFEAELHNNFRAKGYLSKEEIGKLFQKHMSSYMGPAVEQSEGSENWWVYVSHFRYFFYVYSYASGLLISKSLQAEVKKDSKFINKVKEFLSTGISESPKSIFAKLGIDISDKSFWEKGINEVENLLSETESLAKKLGKI